MHDIRTRSTQVEKLATLFPSANVTKMVSRTPGILYLDIDRTVTPKALWIQQAVGLDQDGLDRLIEQGERGVRATIKRHIDFVPRF